MGFQETNTDRRLICTNPELKVCGIENTRLEVLKEGNK